MNVAVAFERVRRQHDNLRIRTFVELASAQREAAQSQLAVFFIP